MSVVLLRTIRCVWLFLLCMRNARTIVDGMEDLAEVVVC